MATSGKHLAELERRFWQSMVDQDTDAALELLHEPSLMVSAHGSMKFDHQGYRKMADHGSMTVTSFDLSQLEVVFPNENTAVVMYHVNQVVTTRVDGKASAQEMNDTSTWIRSGDQWKCVMHTETPAAAGS